MAVRLVTIRSYDSPEQAAEVHRFLVGSGVSACLGTSYFNRRGLVELRVPESEVGTAMEMLQAVEQDPDIWHGPAPTEIEGLRCPRCKSAATIPLPPYPMFAFIPGMALTVWAARRWGILPAAGIAVLSVLAGQKVYQRTPRFRCGNCGHYFRDAA